MKSSDYLVFKQACEKAHIKEKKHGRLPAGWSNTGPGFTCRGSIHDCNRDYFERLLKTYFSNLYVGWNPFKNEGQGIWEVWQKPARKTPILEADCKSYTIYELKYQPNDMEHHVYDLPYLTPVFIDKLREMDTWENKRFFEAADDKQDELEDKYDKMEEESIKYAVRHHKSLFRKLKQFAQDGYNPFWFFSDKRQGDGQV